MVLCTTISYWIPKIPHPILAFHGPQGSGKSSAMRIIWQTFDPASVQLFAIPKKSDDFDLNLEVFYVHPIDNLTRLSEEESNKLCMSVTGGSRPKRTHYKNKEITVVEYQNCVLVNGINTVAKNPDLLERTFICDFEKPKQQKTEQEINETYKKDQPVILSGILNAIAGALSIHPTVKCRSQRLEDFNRWACAIAQALNICQQDYENAYITKMKRQNEEAIAIDPIAAVMLRFVEESVKKPNLPAGLHRYRDHWEDTPENLLKELNSIAVSVGIDTVSKYWPQIPSQLTRRLKKLVSTLYAEGITIQFPDRSKGQRVYIIDTEKYEIENQSDTVPVPPLSQSLYSGLDTVVKIDVVTPEKRDHLRGKPCQFCLKIGDLVFLATHYSGQTQYCCYSCESLWREKQMLIDEQRVF